MKIFLSTILSFLILKIAYTQNTTAFCKAVENGNFKKVERILKRKISVIKDGTTYYNGPGSGMQITHQPNLDSLVLWLKNQSCVEDAALDKCQNKISIYPSWSVIGVKFITGSGIIEKCFHIQEGTTGNVNIFKWRFHLFKARNKLVYRKMYDCDGFVEQQKKLCNEVKN